MSNNATTIATATATTTNEVRIWVERDDDAHKVSAVLEALGYTVLRELEEGDGPARLRWAVNRLAQRHKLTPREQDILQLVLGGRNNEDISKDLDISRATVKWHMHNIFAKSNTGNRESLLRLALQLGGATRPPNGERESEIPTEVHEVIDIARPEVIPAAAVPSKSWD